MKRELGAIVALAGIAFVRVLVLASALPFFHVNDEHQQVDAIRRYAEGQLPGPQLKGLHGAVADWAMRWGTFEYLTPEPAIPPPFARRGLPPDDELLQQAFRRYTSVAGTEFDSPPIYYAVAGAWYRLGEALGLRDLALLYWLRWLDAPALALLVVGSHLLLRRVYPAGSLARLGVPALIAFFPADILYAASVDAFSPLAGGIAFAALVVLAEQPRARVAVWAAGGLATGAAFLTKYTNAIYLALGAAVSATALRWGADARRLAAFAAAALLPAALWLARNLVVLGDLTGTARKVEVLQWSRRPLAAWPEHPLFTPGGLWHFATQLPVLFWRGELPWHGVPMAHAGLDVLYAASSLAFAALVAWSLARHRGRPTERRVEALALGAVLGAAATLAALSVYLDFATWGTPTRDDPFFVHGRLVSGVLLPFAVVWVRGLERACLALPGRAAARAPAWVLAAWIALVGASEIALNAPVFASAWNWYHAGGG